MAVPVIETIALEIFARINEITVANGFEQDLVAVRPKRNDFKDIPPEDGKVLVWQGDEALASKQANPIVEKDQEFLIIALVIDSDSATTSIDTRINQVRADIHKKLMEDHNRGGNANDTLVADSWKFDDGKGFSGVTVQVIVNYWTLDTNPYTVT